MLPTSQWPPLSTTAMKVCEAVANYREELSRTSQGRSLRVRQASMGAEAGRLITQLIKLLGITNILEIGTCVGIGGAYMCAAAAGNGHVRYTGLEGVEEKRTLALKTIRQFAQTADIAILGGDFQVSLPAALACYTALHPLQFVYLDGWHQPEPTIQMFNDCTAAMHTGGYILCDDLNQAALKGVRARLQKVACVVDHTPVLNKDLFVIRPCSV